MRLNKKALNLAKQGNQDQVLLPPGNLDPQIVQELDVNQISLALLPIKEQLDLINRIL